MNFVTHIRELKSATSRFWPDDDDEQSGLSYNYAHAVFAIAQHSGVPTRLLDFTYNSLVAAYFAYDISALLDSLNLSHECLASCFEEFAQNHKESPEEALNTLLGQCEQYWNEIDQLPSEIAVWAIRLNQLYPKTDLRLLNHPRTEIRNLRAQEGVFVFHRGFVEKDVNQGKPWPSFKSELLNLVGSKDVQKFTLPFRERDALWKILERKQVGDMYLMPTYDAAAKASMSALHKYYERRQE